MFNCQLNRWGRYGAVKMNETRHLDETTINYIRYSNKYKLRSTKTTFSSAQNVSSSWLELRRGTRLAADVAHDAVHARLCRNQWECCAFRESRHPSSGRCSAARPARTDGGRAHPPRRLKGSDADVDVGGRAAIRPRWVVRGSVVRAFCSSSKSKRFETFQRYFLISLKLVGQRVDLLVDFSVNLKVDFGVGAMRAVLDWFASNDHSRQVSCHLSVHIVWFCPKTLAGHQLTA